MALIRTGSAAQPKTYGTWHYSSNNISVNIGDVIDVFWANATVPTFSGCTQEVITTLTSSKKIVRLTATGTTISYSGDDYMECYVTY